MSEDFKFPIKNEHRFDYSAELCKGADLNVIDDNAVNNFRNKLDSLQIKTLSNEQLLRSCGVITNAGITNAAIILFGTKSAVQKYFPHVEVIFEYRSSEEPRPPAQRKVFLEGFFNYHDQIWELINLRNNKQHYQYNFYVCPVDTFNEIVVREVVLNAVAHRDYTQSAPICICQYPYILNITNPGGFIKPINPTPDTSVLRNPLIYSVLKFCGLAGHTPHGIYLICKLAVFDGKKLPDYGGTNAFLSKCSLNCTIKNKQLVRMFHEMDESIRQQLTLKDYLWLADFYTYSTIIEFDKTILDHLLDLDIIERLANNAPAYRLSNDYKKRKQPRVSYDQV
jgi:ATP-dependent DNA helicase RecG